MVHGRWSHRQLSLTYGGSPHLAEYAFAGYLNWFSSKGVRGEGIYTFEENQLCERRGHIPAAPRTARPPPPRPLRGGAQSRCAGARWCGRWCTLRSTCGLSTAPAPRSPNTPPCARSRGAPPSPAPGVWRPESTDQESDCGQEKAFGRRDADFEEPKPFTCLFAAPHVLPPHVTLHIMYLYLGEWSPRLWGIA
eukprot:1194779-Prorocentrum_minimum.AAC.1